MECDIERTQDDSSFVIANPKSKKAVIVGEVENNGYKMVVAYLIDVHKWYWAELEGFSRDEIISKLALDIFTHISLEEVAESLK